MMQQNYVMSTAAIVAEICDIIINTNTATVYKSHCVSDAKAVTVTGIVVMVCKSIIIIMIIIMIILIIL